MTAGFDGVPMEQCGAIAVESGVHGGASTNRRVRSRDYPNPGFWILNPGQYEVRAINCIDGLKVNGSAGYGNYVVYAKFSVSAGEVLNIGHLAIGGDAKNRKLSVDDLGPETLEGLNREFPKYANRMTKKFMAVDVATTNVQEAALEKTAANAFSFRAVLPAIANAPMPVKRN